MFCPNCGKNISDETVYCPYCGRLIPTSSETSENEDKPHKEKVSIPLCVLSFFIPASGMTIWFLKRKEEPRKAKACLIVSIVAMVIWLALGIVLGIIVYNEIQDYIDINTRTVYQQAPHASSYTIPSTPNYATPYTYTPILPYSHY